MTPAVLVATWSDGLFVLDGETRLHELAGESVRGITSDGSGGALAIVGGRSLRRRSPQGAWTTLVTSDVDLSCAVAVGALIYVGTDDARVLRVGPRGRLEDLPGFASVPGRDTWYAGGTLIDGRFLGPPLGIRSIAATADKAALLANVHVGGVPRSLDGGTTWRPTLDVDSDVHEVRAHATRPGVVAAAAATGLWISHDAGATWSRTQDGLHATYCAAVAFLGDQVLVSASTDHFARESAVYRRAVDGQEPLVPLGDGLPRWLAGIVDTGCIATRAATLAVADKGGNVSVSVDAGPVRRWAEGLPAPSSILVT